MINYDKRFIQNKMDSINQKPKPIKRKSYFSWFILGILLLTILFIYGCKTDNNIYLHLINDSKYDYILNIVDNSGFEYKLINSDSNYIEFQSETYHIKDFIEMYNKPKVKKSYNYGFIFGSIGFVFIIIILIFLYIKRKQLDEWGDEE